MKHWIRAGLVVASAAGFCFALSTLARADVVTPESALQPASTRLVSDQASDHLAKPAKVVPFEEVFSEASDQAVKGSSDEVVATPAPEQVVTRAPSALSQVRTVRAVEGSVFDRVVNGLRTGQHKVGEFLGRVVSGCQVPFGSGTGGPVLVLGVFMATTAFAGRRFFGIRLATDDGLPRFLFARELTPPG